MALWYREFEENQFWELRGLFVEKNVKHGVHDPASPRSSTPTALLGARLVFFCGNRFTHLVPLSVGR